MLALFTIYLKLFVPHKTLQCSDGNISDKRRQNYSSANMIRVYYGATMTQCCSAGQEFKHVLLGLLTLLESKLYINLWRCAGPSWEALSIHFNIRRLEYKLIKRLSFGLEWSSPTGDCSEWLAKLFIASPSTQLSIVLFCWGKFCSLGQGHRQSFGWALYALTVSTIATKLINFYKWKEQLIKEAETIAKWCFECFYRMQAGRDLARD